MSARINEIENREWGSTRIKGSLTAQPPPFCARFRLQIGWRTHSGVCHMCVRRPLVSPRTHRKRRDVCATPAARLERRQKTRCETAKIKNRKTNLECPLESMREKMERGETCG